MKITTRCGEPAVAGLNEALLAKAAAGKLLRTNRVRADTTVIPANVAYPTDSGLLAKAVGKLVRTARRALAASSRTGVSAPVPTAGQWEPGEPRGSRRVLRAAGVRFPPPTLLIVLCASRTRAEEARRRVGEILAGLGLQLHPDKTRTACLTRGHEGFDFLGFHLHKVEA